MNSLNRLSNAGGSAVVFLFILWKVSTSPNALWPILFPRNIIGLEVGPKRGKARHNNIEVAEVEDFAWVADKVDILVFTCALAGTEAGI